MCLVVFVGMQNKDILFRAIQREEERVTQNGLNTCFAIRDMMGFYLFLQLLNTFCQFGLTVF